MGLSIKKTAVLAISFAALAIFLPACVSPTAPTPASPAVNTPGGSNFVLSSPAFADGANIPKKFSCDGDKVSPQLQWSGAPSGTRSLALIVDDPDAPGGTFTHWVVFDIVATQNGIAEGAANAGKAGRNSAGQAAYTSPCPPSGTHRYYFTLYALDVDSLGLSVGASRADVEKALGSHVLAKTQLMGRYAR